MMLLTDWKPLDHAVNLQKPDDSLTKEILVIVVIFVTSNKKNI